MNTKPKYLSLEQDEIISLLKRARKNYITCKANRSQETWLWGTAVYSIAKVLR